MRSAHFKAASLALAILSAAVALARAGVDVSTASETNGQVVVRLDNHMPPNYAPIKTFYVAIGPTGTYSASFFSGPPPSSAKGAAVAAGPVRIDTLSVSTPFSFRGARVLRMKVQIPVNTPQAHVIVNFTPAANVADAATADPLVKQLVVNQSIFPFAPAAGASGSWFSRAAGWARLTVTDRGMYVVNGSDLGSTGINITSIDPATLRLYSQGGIEQSRDLTDPRGSWRPDQAMHEVAIRVEAGGDGTFDPGDRIIFYGIGTQDWADFYNTTAPDSLFQEHSHALTNYYYLAWGGTLPGTPASISDTDATPGAGPDRTTYTQREYRERDLIADLDFRGDGWLWLDVQRPSTISLYPIGTVTASDVVTSVPQQFFSVGLSPYQSCPANAPPTCVVNNDKHHAVFIRSHGSQDVTIGGKVWDTLPGQDFYEDGTPIHITSNFMVDGDNLIRLKVPGDLNSIDKMRFAWYAIWYERRIAATGDAAMFSTPDTTGAMNVRARRFSLSGTMYAFDVTDMWNPLRLTGAEVATAGSERTVRLGMNPAGRHRHLWVGTPNGFKKPGVTRISPVDLRADATGPNMVIITHRDLKSAADKLRTYRSGHLPFFPNPSVKVVSTDDVYDNFSGGMPDPMGIRNYIKYLYDNYVDGAGNHRLAYVLLLGDATEDFLNHASSQPDFVPSNLYFTQQTLFAFSTDEWYAHLDPEDQQSGHGVDDVAVGRLPAGSSQEASFMVDKVIGYETGAPLEDWRHRIILLADDTHSSFVGACETEWTAESELIARFHAPDFASIQKIYLVEYPAIAGVKPTSRLAFLDAWNAGALQINYIGHGSSVQMADEQVFLASDVSQLVNGERLPLLTAFSCTIGDFANPAGKSLSEKLLLRDGGGVIATITASRETYPDPNSRVCFSLFEEMFPSRLGQPATPVGVALMHAKLFGAVDTGWYYFQEENNWKYNLMGDPAMRLAIPGQQVRWSIPDPDTLVAGVRHALHGAVYANGAVDTGFNGPVSVIVREPQLHRAYRPDCPGFLDYYLPGGPIYQGTVDAKNGQFQVSFRVPRYAATGPLAYAGSYAHNGARDAANSVDSVLVVVPPTLADSLALRPLDGAPRVDLGFKSGLKVVKAGDTVRARVRDADGINILNTTNEGRQAVLLDNLPVPIDVNQYFSYDHGGTDTSGVLLYPLPDLHVGHHRLVYKVSDSFGFTTLDTLQFDVTDAANYYAEAPFNYPNPFKDSTKFLFRISNRASIKLEIYTVSGKFVRRLEDTRDGGEAWIEWDGRNGSGGDVANGSYLYVATIDFVGVDRPPVVLRGRLSRIR
jgi:Peptidase family C25